MGQVQRGKSDSWSPWTTPTKISKECEFQFLIFPRSMPGSAVGGPLNLRGVLKGRSSTGKKESHLLWTAASPHLPASPRPHLNPTSNPPPNPTPNLNPALPPSPPKSGFVPCGPNPSAAKEHPTQLDRDQKLLRHPNFRGVRFMPWPNLAPSAWEPPMACQIARPGLGGKKPIGLLTSPPTHGVVAPSPAGQITIGNYPGHLLTPLR